MKLDMFTKTKWLIWCWSNNDTHSHQMAPPQSTCTLLAVVACSMA